MTCAPPLTSAKASCQPGSSLRGQARILLVEGNATLRREIVDALGARLGEVEEAGNGVGALECLADARTPAFDLVISDLRPSGVAGMAVLDAARRRDPATRVLMMGSHSRVQDVVEVMRAGACDFLAKPFDLAELERRVARALSPPEGPATSLTPAELQSRDASVIAESPAMREAVALALQVATVRSSVLLTGETGTGKEVLASLLHAHSPRSSGPFVKLNCAALPEPLLESELFGHEQGAFTGADRARTGRFEEASGGTLFLDEIGEMSPTTQAKLLRVLQDQEFHRLGGTKTMRTDARIVAATNRDLERAVANGDFREDLYFRLDVIGIHLPPLRERQEDMIALCDHFLATLGRDLERPRTGFSAAARARMAAYSWPGNVRELRNTIERAVLMSDGREIQAADLGIPDQQRGAEACGRAWHMDLPPGGISLEAVQREVVLAALRRTDFVQKDAAALIDVSPRKLNYMIARMGLTHDSWRRNRSDVPSG